MLRWGSGPERMTAILLSNEDVPTACSVFSKRDRGPINLAFPGSLYLCERSPLNPGFSAWSGIQHSSKRLIRNRLRASDQPVEQLYRSSATGSCRKCSRLSPDKFFITSSQTPALQRSLVLSALAVLVCTSPSRSGRSNGSEWLFWLLWSSWSWPPSTSFRLACGLRSAARGQSKAASSLRAALDQKFDKIAKPIEITTEDIKQQRKEYSDDILQPFRDGQLSREYLEKFGAKKRIVVTKQDAENAKNVWIEDKYYHE